MTTLLIAEHEHSTLKDSTNKALTAATQLGGEVHVLVAGGGEGTKAAAEAAAKLAGVKKVLETLRRTHDLVVVDCTAFFNDTTLAILDAADVILTMLSLEITSIKNMRLFLEVTEQLGYAPGKVRLVLNRADSTLGIRVADVEHSIGRKVDETIVSDGRSVVYALNRGVPFFLSNREAQVSQDILRRSEERRVGKEC